MKRIFLLMAIALSVGCYAQKGRSGLGLGLTYGASTSDYDATGFGISLKYQYAISNVFEIEPSATYYFSGKVSFPDGWINEYSPYKLIYAFGANLHTYFLKTRLRPYLITGFQAYGIKLPEYVTSHGFIDGPDFDSSLLVSLPESSTGGNSIKPAAHLGAGADFRVSYHSNLQLEAGYDTYLTAFVNFTYVYKF